MYKINYKDDKITVLWNEYAEKRNIGLNKDANKLLEKLIELFKTRDNEFVDDFVNYLSNLKFEDNTDITFQYPLLTKILYPSLLRSFREKRVPQTRWLFQLLKDTFFRPKDLNTDLFSVLKIALQLDPNDLTTVSLLIKAYLGNLSYGSHEIPSGLLITKDEFKLNKNELTILLNKYKNTTAVNDEIMTAFNFYIKLYQDWYSYKESNNQLSFIDWCKQENINYKSYNTHKWWMKELNE